MLETDESGLSVPYRLYPGKTGSRSPPLVLYLAGTGFQPAPDMSRRSDAAQCFADAGAVVVEADYASLSGNLFPKALEYAFRAFMAISARRKAFAGAKSRFVVAGHESGGNLAASVALKARDYRPGELAGQVLLSPMVDASMATSSFLGADAGMQNRWADGWSRYLGPACSYQHPYATPCLCSRMAGVAPALVVTSEDDPLRDETLGYIDRLTAADVAVRRKVFAAEQDWTSLYRGETGLWRQELCEELSQFLAGLQG
ncbi:acetyl esterase/lipase [Rhizobium paknamense]|uniref:Acetyl esterase/lipase n=2 Tax=Rhizobium paknamense TaxID=1206817 RepID=A0ABU0IBN9_9HYPH|nr:acetyl esterase/lipase [Rhizobium paknamense]